VLFRNPPHTHTHLLVLIEPLYCYSYMFGCFWIIVRVDYIFTQTLHDLIICTVIIKY